MLDPGSTLELSLPFSLVSSIFLFSKWRSFCLSYLRLQTETSIFIGILQTPKLLNCRPSLFSFRILVSLPLVSMLVFVSHFLGPFLRFPFFSILSVPLSSASFRHKTIWASRISSKFKRFFKKLLRIEPPSKYHPIFQPQPNPLPNACSLCFSVAESIDHLFIRYPFSWRL